MNSVFLSKGLFVFLGTDSEYRVVIIIHCCCIWNVYLERYCCVWKC